MTGWWSSFFSLEMLSGTSDNPCKFDIKQQWCITRYGIIACWPVCKGGRNQQNCSSTYFHVRDALIETGNHLILTYGKTKRIATNIGVEYTSVQKFARIYHLSGIMNSDCFTRSGSRLMVIQPAFFLRERCIWIAVDKILNILLLQVSIIRFLITG